MFRGAVLTGLPNPVVGIDGSSLFLCNAPAEELVPSDMALGMECLSELALDQIGRTMPYRGDNRSSGEPLVLHA